MAEVKEKLINLEDLKAVVDALRLLIDAKATPEDLAAMVDSAPEMLNTLNELAAALGDDPNFATTVATQIGNKADAVHGHALDEITETEDKKIMTAAERDKLKALPETISDYVLPEAGEDLGGVKSGEDVTITAGMIKVNNATKAAQDGDGNIIVDTYATKNEATTQVSDDGEGNVVLTNVAVREDEVSETDPTVPDWAKQPEKPTYTAEEIGARPDTWVPKMSEIDGTSTFTKMEVKTYTGTQTKGTNYVSVTFSFQPKFFLIMRSDASSRSVTYTNSDGGNTQTTIQYGMYVGYGIYGEQYLTNTAGGNYAISLTWSGNTVSFSCATTTSATDGTGMDRFFNFQNEEYTCIAFG